MVSLIKTVSHKWVIMHEHGKATRFIEATIFRGTQLEVCESSFKMKYERSECVLL